MSSINRVTLMGRLGADPEVRRLASGDPVVSLRLATSERWTDKASGERKERTEWHSVVIFNAKLCELAEKYLAKGHLVFVEGQLSTRKWQGQDGQDRYTTEIVLRAFNGELKLLPQGSGNKPAAPGSQDDYGTVSGREPAANSASKQAGKPAEQSSGMKEFLDDEIPF